MTHVVPEPTADVPTGLCVDDAGCPRCSWCQATPGYRHYHDHEWGFPVADDRRLFEKLCLEGFQSGLSWLTILNKREGFRAAFSHFDAEQVAALGARDVERLVQDAAIVRHRGKIESTINNARRVLELRREFGSLAHYVWRHEPAAADRPGRITREVARTLSTSPDHCPGQRPEKARLEFCGAHHDVCLHAGHGAGERPSGRLPCAHPGPEGPGKVCGAVKTVLYGRHARLRRRPALPA